MNCRRALHTDYEELCRWWEAHGWDAVPEAILPFGLVAEKDGEIKAAGFLYVAGNAPVGYLEYVVSNPDNSARESYEAIDLVLGELMKQVKYNMLLACFARMAQDPLGRLYEKHGFFIGDTVKDAVWRIN